MPSRKSLSAGDTKKIDANARRFQPRVLIKKMRFPNDVRKITIKLDTQIRISFQTETLIEVRGSSEVLSQRDVIYKDLRKKLEMQKTIAKKLKQVANTQTQITRENLEIVMITENNTTFQESQDIRKILTESGYQPMPENQQN